MEGVLKKAIEAIAVCFVAWLLFSCEKPTIDPLPEVVEPVTITSISLVNPVTGKSQAETLLLNLEGVGLYTATFDREQIEISSDGVNGVMGRYYDFAVNNNDYSIYVGILANVQTEVVTGVNIIIQGDYLNHIKFHKTNPSPSLQQTIDGDNLSISFTLNESMRGATIGNGVEDFSVADGDVNVSFTMGWTVYLGQIID